MYTLPLWVLPNSKPGFYDTESATTIEQTAKLYQAMLDLINEYNSFATNVNEKIAEFMTGTEKDYDVFKVALRQEFQDFIDVIELKYQSQDTLISERLKNMSDAYDNFTLSINNKINNQNNIIADAVKYLKDNLNGTIESIIVDMRNSGELTDVVMEALDDFTQRLNELETTFTNLVSNLETELKNQIETNNNNLQKDIAEVGSKIFHVTPQMFGAVGDGVTDDTEAFLQLNGKHAFIPEGTYIVSQLVFGANTRLVGSGMQKTIIKQHPDHVDKDMIIMQNANDSMITKLTLEGNYEEYGVTSNLESHNYKGLLKVKTTTDSENSNQRAIFEHIEVKKSSGSGIVLLGNRGDKLDNSETGYNWVYLMNDIRIEECRKYCMIDETSDNKYFNLMFSGGGLANLYCNCSSNIYVNVKLDNVGGKFGSLDDNSSGALLIINQCGNLQFTNLDVQSAGIDGVKVYQSWGIQMQGSINNVGLANEEQGTCLKILGASQSSVFDFLFYSSGYQTMRDIYVSDEPTEIVINKMNEFHVSNPKENDFFDPKRVTVTRPTTWKNIAYDFKVPISKLFTNLIEDQMCEDVSKWSIDEGITINGSLYEGKSFKMTGNGDYQTIKATLSLIPNHVYFAFFVASAESVSSSNLPFPYINLDGQADILFRNILKQITLNEKTLVQCMFKALGDSARLIIMNAQNTSVSSVGNICVVDLTELFPAVEENTSFYNMLIEHLLPLMESKFETLGVTYTNPLYLPAILSDAGSNA